MSADPARSTPVSGVGSRVTAKQARELATVAGLRGAERELFMLLARLHNPGTPTARRRAWLMDQMGVSRATVIRATHSLERRGLLTVERGDGRTWSSFLVNFAPLGVAVMPVKPTVHAGENVTPQGSQNETPGVSKRDPRGLKTRPQGSQNETPLRARDARDARANQRFTRKDPPSPTPGVGDGPLDEASPTASGGAPFSEKCQHGRTETQGCRRCGTDSRTAAKREAAKRADAERTAALERARARHDAEMAATPPPDGWRPPRRDKSTTTPTGAPNATP